MKKVLVIMSIIMTMLLVGCGQKEASVINDDGKDYERVKYYDYMPETFAKYFSEEEFEVAKRDTVKELKNCDWDFEVREETIDELIRVVALTERDDLIEDVQLKLVKVFYRGGYLPFEQGLRDCDLAWLCEQYGII